MAFEVCVQEDGDIEIKAYRPRSFTIHLVVYEDEILEELELYGADPGDILQAVEMAKMTDQWVKV
jgi:hypothetical protein